MSDWPFHQPHTADATAQDGVWGSRREVAITYADRFTRFGLAYLEYVYDSFGVTLTMLELQEDKTPEQELTTDLLSVIASFSGRMSGMRSHKQKELVTCAQAEIFSP